jgi:hypothetical protein
MATDHSEIGSDESAQEVRRRVQKIVRTGDEEGIPVLFNYIKSYLQVPARSKDAKFYLPAAMAAAEGIGKLCNPEEEEAEGLLIQALGGSNRLQCAAADALGSIGTANSALGPLENVANIDKSAAVRARAKIAIRRIEQRYRQKGVGTVGKVRTADELRSVLEQAFPQSEPVVKKGSEDNVHISNLHQVKISPSEKRTQTVYIQIGSPNDATYAGSDSRTDVEQKQAGLSDVRALAGLNIHLNYIVLFTPCGPASKNPQEIFKQYKKVLEINARRLTPEKYRVSVGKHKNQEFFSQGALGVYSNPDLGFNDEFCMFETLPLETVSVGTLKDSVKVLAFVGDEVERALLEIMTPRGN